MNALIRLAFVACLLFVQQDAGAHARSESYSSWRIVDGTVTGVVTVSAGEVMTLVELGNAATLEKLFAAHLAESVSVSSESGACPSAEPTILSAARGFLRIEIRFSCESGAPTLLRYRALFDELPAHVHFARIYDRDALLAETLFTEHSDNWSNDATDLREHSVAAFLELGVRHILSGVDHIAFLLGMLLVAGTFARSVAAVTGFTLGHSISLGAAVLGYLQADGRLVEAFIGFTVALVAIEYFLMRRPSSTGLAATAMLCAWTIGAVAVGANLIPAASVAAYLGFGIFAFCYLIAASRIPARGYRLGGIVLFAATTAFGLIHGFGFAGFLMDTGIRGDSLVRPLLGFNVGVEIGQLALLTLAFAAARVLRGTNFHRLAPVAAAGLCGIGVFWFVGRSLAA